MNSSSNCNDLHLNYPWINTSLFEKCIQKDHKNDDVIIIDSFTLAPALKKGENYLSQMMRAKVDYKINNVANQINFIIKAQLLNAPESLRLNELFSREIAVFQYVIPRAEELLKGIGDDTKFSAKCYEANSEEYYLIFEDLIARGYENPDRQIGLTVEKFESAFLLLAKWHATTSILLQTDNHIMRPFDYMFSTPFYETLVKSIIKRTAQFTRECTPDDELANKLEAMSEQVFHKIMKADEKTSNEFICLCHSDLWSNNIMLNESFPMKNKALLIDFQMVHAGSPVLDLCYSLFSSSDISMREKEFDYLLQYYHEQLSTILQKLGYKNEIPTLDTLHSQMLERGIYGVPLGILGTVGRYSTNEEENADMDLITSESQQSETHWYNLLRNPKCHDKVIFLLDYFNAKGYFDI